MWLLHAATESWKWELGAAGRKHNGLPELLENHLNSIPVGTIVFVRKNGAARDLVKNHEISHSYPALWFPVEAQGFRSIPHEQGVGVVQGCQICHPRKGFLISKVMKFLRLELWTCGKSTSYATRMVWITRVKFQYDFSIKPAQTYWNWWGRGVSPSSCPQVSVACDSSSATDRHANTAHQR